MEVRAAWPMIAAWSATAADLAPINPSLTQIPNVTSISLR
jgi:hypothetical protein